MACDDRGCAGDCRDCRADALSRVPLHVALRRPRTLDDLCRVTGESFHVVDRAVKSLTDEGLVRRTGLGEDARYIADGADEHADPIDLLGEPTGLRDFAEAAGMSCQEAGDWLLAAHNGGRVEFAGFANCTDAGCELMFQRATPAGL